MALFIEHEGVKYWKVERKAEVGDLITYSYKGNYDDIPRKVIEVTYQTARFEPYGNTSGYAHGAYDVLEEVSEPQPDVHALIANLGRRLHEVESAIAPKEFEVTDLSASYPKYFKDVSDLDSIDVYKTHELFGIDDPSGAIQHASKKLLLSGARTGGKSKFTDIKEARDTLNRWLEINAIDEAASAEASE